MGARISLMHAMIGIQLLFFMSLVFVFTQMEQSRTAELHDLKLQLSRLRRENLHLATSSAPEVADAPPAPEAAEATPRKRKGKLPKLPKLPKKPPLPPPVELEATQTVASEESHTATDAKPDAASKLDGLRGKCARLKVEWWVYEVCLFDSAQQLHDADNAGAREGHSLGTFHATTSSSRVQRFCGGENCEGAAHGRTAEVHLRCPPPDDGALDEIALVEVTEPAMCEYHMEVHEVHRRAMPTPRVRRRSSTCGASRTTRCTANGDGGSSSPSINTAASLAADTPGSAT